jgi:hypothetical protein
LMTASVNSVVSGGRVSPQSPLSTSELPTSEVHSEAPSGSEDGGGGAAGGGGGEGGAGGGAVGAEPGKSVIADAWAAAVEAYTMEMRRSLQSQIFLGMVASQAQVRRQCLCLCLIVLYKVLQ